MATNAVLLSNEIASSLGHPGNVTVQVLGFAQGILEELTQNGVASIGPTPSPYSISGMTGASMASKIANYAGYGFVSPILLNYCTGICNYIQASAIITYTGPGGLPPSFFLGGTIAGLDGNAMASVIAPSAGYPYISLELIAKSTAIVNHIMTNATVNNTSIA